MLTRWSLVSCVLWLWLWPVPNLAAEEASDQFSPKVRAAIMAVFAKQEKCWNAGDLECFMSGYWRSEKLTFIGSKGVTRGWQRTLDNYRRSYPDKAAMGELRFDVLNMEDLGKRQVYVIGKWHLTRAADELEGHFSLIWRLIDGAWVIVADHSS